MVAALGGLPTQKNERKVEKRAEGKGGFTYREDLDRDDWLLDLHQDTRYLFPDSPPLPLLNGSAS
jgi:hypothetical protein